MLARKKNDLSNMEACVQAAFTRREPKRELTPEMTALLKQFDKQDGGAQIAW